METIFILSKIDDGGIRFRGDSNAYDKDKDFIVDESDVFDTMKEISDTYLNREGLIVNFICE